MTGPDPTPERITLDRIAADGTIVTDDGNGRHHHWDGTTSEHVATHDGPALGVFGQLVAPCSAIPPGEVWIAPADVDTAAAAIRCFGPGTTAGGRAEAGWRIVGRIADDGPVLKLSPETVVELVEHQDEHL